VSYRETYDNLCVLLEEYADAEVETVAEQILAMLGLTSEDLVDQLDPPPGLRHWLLSHGLSLLTTSEQRSPRVWEALEAEEAPETHANDLEEEPGESLLLQVGDHVDYRTAPNGPHNQSLIGSGRIKAIHEAQDTGSNIVIVQTGPGAPEVWLDSHMDFIRPVQTP
jgi:hypothetical protein